MAINFNASPTLGEQLTVDGKTWEWNGTFWASVSNSAEPGSGRAYVGEDPPLAPSGGDLWWNSTLGILLVYFEDQDSAQWVEATPNSLAYAQAASSSAVLADQSAVSAQQSASDAAASAAALSAINFPGRSPNVATSGNVLEFSIPSWATKIEIHTINLRMANATDMLVQVGTSSAWETSGYTTFHMSFITSSTYNFSEVPTTGWLFARHGTASQNSFGKFTLTKSTDIQWKGEGHAITNGPRESSSYGYKDMAGPLTRVRLTPASGNFSNIGLAFATWSAW